MGVLIALASGFAKEKQACKITSVRPPVQSLASVLYESVRTGDLDPKQRHFR